MISRVNFVEKPQAYSGKGEASLRSKHRIHGELCADAGSVKCDLNNRAKKDQSATRT
jgi:hypothetical protein